ncbi:putative membrane protein [Bradyrhizobium sp. i1.3.1]
MIAGYDAAPIDGVDGPKTQAALAAFLKSRGLAADIMSSPNFFKTMVDAVQTPSATGLTWCNDTPHKVMAAVATDDGKSVTSRGWYRIDPKTCLHPDVTGQPKQIFSFAEAIDADNRVIKLKDKPLNWGGDKQLCTRETKFETNEQADCGARADSRRRVLAWWICRAAARRCALRCRDGSDRATNSAVVPANAGTHNHRPQLLGTM